VELLAARAPKLRQAIRDAKRDHGQRRELGEVVIARVLT